MRGVDLQVDRLSIYALIVSRYSCGFVLNLPLDFAKIVESPARDVIELTPLILPSY